MSEFLVTAGRTFLEAIRRGKDLRAPIPRDRSPLAKQAVPTQGEAGCYLWPSVTPEGVVTTRFIPLRDTFSIQTVELERTLGYLFEKSLPIHLEYVRGFDGVGSFLGTQGYEIDQRGLNLKHVALENSFILSLDDPQVRMGNIAQNLQSETRQLARHAVVLPDQAENPPPDGPPLRDFARRYATFLSRMCINRGCEKPLLRTVELSLRDECFSSTLMDIFFRDHPTARTLQSCRIKYVGR